MIRPRPGRILATVGAAQILNVASVTAMAVTLPALGRDLGASGTEQQWVIDAFVLVFASLLIAGGVLGDRHGRRTALLTGLVIFAAGSLWCTLAPSVEWLIVGRVVQALGPPLTLPASLAILTSAYADPSERARAIGRWGAGSGLGLALGPPLGGLLVDTLSWRWVFAVNLPVCALLIWLALREIPRDRPFGPQAPFDALAAALITATVGLVVFTLIEGREAGWGSPAVLGALAGALLLGTWFVRRELGHPAPLVQLRLLRSRPFAAANLGAAVLYGAMTGSAVYVSVFLQQVQHRSALTAGLCLLPVGALTALFAPVAGRLTARGDARIPILTGMLVACAGFLALARLDADTSLRYTWGAYALLGTGTGLALPPMTVAALAAVRSEAAGMASAIHNASRQLGQTLAVAALGTIILSASHFAGGLHVALLSTAAALAVTAAVLTLLIPRR